MKIPLIKLDPELPTPRRAHDGDAGADLFAREDTTLEPGAWAAVPTGVAIAVPDGHVGLVAPRSGLAARNAISVVNGPGVIDAGYRGEIKAILINHSDAAVSLRRGDRIAQLLVLPAPDWEFAEVEALDESSRGEGGFGSTGA
jgi:dUTP pyrophosphatase